MKVAHLTALVAGLLAMPAFGDVVTYSDATEFATATGSTIATLPNASSSTITVTGKLTLKAAAAGNMVSGTSIAGYWSLRPNFMGKSGVESFDVTPLAPSYAFGFWLYEPTSTALKNGCNTTCVDSTFEVSLYSGATKLGGYVIKPPNNTFAFYGYWSSEQITLVTIREIVGTNDNEFFGDFAIGSKVLPPPPPKVQLELRQSVVAGCKSTTGTVALPAALATDAVVAISETLASATAPATVTIPAGATTANFTIKTSQVLAQEDGTVGASYEGKSVSQALTVRPIGMQSVTFKPTPAIGGKPVTGTAKLECKSLLAPVTVDLESADPGVAATVAPSVVVAQGLQSATFDVTTTPVLARTSVAISATANGVQKVKTLVVQPAAAVAPTSLKFGSVPVGQTSGALSATLSNLGIAPFDVGAIAITGTYANWFAHTSNCPASLAPGASCTISVTFTPVAALAKSAKLTIPTSATSTPLSVSLSGTGL